MNKNLSLIIFGILLLNSEHPNYHCTITEEYDEVYTPTDNSGIVKRTVTCTQDISEKFIPLMSIPDEELNKRCDLSGAEDWDNEK
jgi:hypothetical protein